MTETPINNQVVPLDIEKTPMEPASSSAVPKRNDFSKKVLADDEAGKNLKK